MFNQQNPNENIFRYIKNDHDEVVHVCELFTATETFIFKLLPFFIVIEDKKFFFL